MDARDILIRPLITERGTDLMQDNKFVFVVDKRANKIQIAQAVKEVFNVTVENVNTMNVKGKTKSRGRTIGRTSSYKKAIVKLQPGDTIELFGA